MSGPTADSRYEHSQMVRNAVRFGGAHLSLLWVHHQIVVISDYIIIHKMFGMCISPDHCYSALDFFYFLLFNFFKFLCIQMVREETNPHGCEYAIGDLSFSCIDK